MAAKCSYKVKSIWAAADKNAACERREDVNAGRYNGHVDAKVDEWVIFCTDKP